jgi:hypothetical protein
LSDKENLNIKRRNDRQEIFTNWTLIKKTKAVECAWNVMAHAQKPDFVFQRNGRIHLHQRGLQFSRLLAAEMCASAVIMLDTPCSEVVWRVLATHSIRQFPLHLPSLRDRVPSHFNWTLQHTAGQLFVAFEYYSKSVNLVHEMWTKWWFDEDE